MQRIIAWVMVAMFALAIVPAYASSGCADKHENVSRFNPTELSDYQKCVFKWKGQEVGTVGQHIWMQHNGEFIYIKMDKLVGKSNAQIETVVINTIIKTVIDNELLEAERKLVVLKDLKIAELDVEIDRLQARIDSLTKITKAASITDHAHIKTFRTTKLQHSTDTSDIIAIEYYNGIVEGAVQWVSVPIDGDLAWQLNRFSGTELAKLKILVADVAEAAYKQGYQDGYRDGYIDGYNQAVDDLNK